MTQHPIQVGHPAWSSAGDVDPDEAADTREVWFNRLAGTNTVLAAGHYPVAAIGRVNGVPGETLVWEPR